ncbi:glycoside hydrolase family 5 protein [Edaphobacter aggregans]|uniref:glycoside hydrolase family 5 protein n=1 Tax=Edaphobacter aggregans TaxID=570835 RepID=UPI00068F411B|nr:glycoside hydrolase family 5 protein [Edaphobacter aggregans]
MSSISAFFLAILHFLALTWATIHPAVPPNHHSPAVRVLTTQVRYQQSLPSDDQSNVVDASVRASDTGYWHTSGSQILNSRGLTVRIQGINWYGFETVREIPGGLTLQDYRTILDTIRRSGFNTVRIPLSNQMLEQPIVPSSIGFINERGPINEPLRGLNSLEILDRIIEHAGSLGLKVILDNHRSEAGNSAEQSGLWYTPDFPETMWIADWQRLAHRYANNTTVIGFDLRNEPHNAAGGGACWDCGGDRDWHLAAQRAGDAVLAINPRLLIFVEGVDAVDGDFYWWGGNLEGVSRSPVRLSVPNQLVYSPHTYGPNEYRQRWFNASTTPASLEAVWTRHWAFISQRGIAPIWVGEFGTGNRIDDITGAAPGSQAQWFQSLVAFLGRNPEISWTSWALNGEDNNGLLDAGYEAPANALKMQTLASLMSTTPATGTVAQINSPAYGRTRQ